MPSSSKCTIPFKFSEKKFVRIHAFHVCATHLFELLTITGFDKLEIFQDISGKILRTFKANDEAFRSRVYTV